MSSSIARALLQRMRTDHPDASVLIGAHGLDKGEPFIVHASVEYGMPQALTMPRGEGMAYALWGDPNALESAQETALLHALSQLGYYPAGSTPEASPEPRSTTEAPGRATAATVADPVALEVFGDSKAEQESRRQSPAMERLIEVAGADKIPSRGQRGKGGRTPKKGSTLTAEEREMMGWAVPQTATTTKDAPTPVKSDDDEAGAHMRSLAQETPRTPAIALPGGPVGGPSNIHQHAQLRQLAADGVPIGAMLMERDWVVDIEALSRDQARELIIDARAHKREMDSVAPSAPSGVS